MRMIVRRCVLGLFVVFSLLIASVSGFKSMSILNLQNRIRNPHTSGKISKMSLNAVESVPPGRFGDMVLESKHPVIVDFTASWCGPCRMMAPEVEHLAELLKGKDVTVLKVDIDEHDDVMHDYRFEGVPSFGIFKNGKIVALKTGAMSRTQLHSFISQHVEME